MNRTATKASPKPARGEAAKQRRARRRLVETRERKAKDAAKERDAYTCRRCRTEALPWWPVEAAHLTDKGMGGDNGRHSHRRSDFVTLCRNCHRGPRSLHSGHLRAVYGPDGGDGPVTFEDVTPKRLHDA